MKEFNLSQWALKHRTLVAYFMLVSLMAGTAAFVRLGREEDPAFTIKTMVVSMSWPGATTDQMLQQVTDRVERKLQELPSLDNLRSYTKPGESVVLVTFREDTPAAKVPDLFYQVRKKINDVRGTFPTGVVGPSFNDEFGDTFGIIYAFTADGFSYRELRDYVDQARDRILKVPFAGKADLIGVQEEKIYVEFSPRKLAGFGFDRHAALGALQAQNIIAPAGVIQADDERILVRVTGSFQSEQDLLAINLRANDRFLRLGDIATIRRDFSDPPQPMFRYNGQPAVGLALSMVAGGDVLTFGHAVDQAVTRVVADLPVGIEVHTVANQPHVVEHAIGGFTKTLTEAVVIVLVVSFLSLGMRAGLVVALSIPLVLAMTFVGMELLGITLQRISLGALIIALGLLVDDAMITVEMMITKLEQGWDRVRAASFAFTSTAVPMLTGTLVTVAGFLPVGFAKSSAGEYCYSLFQVIGLALMLSWIVAVVFSPLLGVWLLPARMAAGHGGGHAPPLARLFRRVAAASLRLRWLTLGLTLALFVAAMAGFGLVEQQFFPASDRPELLVDLTLPQNAAIAATARAVDALEKDLKGDADIAHWSSYVGRGAVRFYLPLDVQLSHDFFGQLVIVTQDIAARERVRVKLERILREEAAFENVIGKVTALDNGPPTGWPVQYRVSAETPEAARALAMRVSQIVAASPAVGQVVQDWNEPAKVVRLRVNQDAARLLGLSSDALAQAINLVVTGQTVTTFHDGNRSVDVVVRANAEERQAVETLRTLQLLPGDGRQIALSQVVDFEYALEAPMVWRRDRQTTVTVKATVNSGVQAATVADALAPALAVLTAGLPPGQSIAVGGVVESSAKANASLGAVAPLMLLVMITILMLQLQDLPLLALVFSVAPLGLIGVVAALLTTGTPMGFVAILGCIALIGMIIRNAVILVDQIETNRANGMDRWTATLEATCDRLRPILLTAVAAILGMVPIASEVFWGPMAYAVMGGLAGATLLTLFFLPALYVTVFRAHPPATIAGQHCGGDGGRATQ